MNHQVSERCWLETEEFNAVFNPKNGGLTSLVLKNDPDKMNWIKGHRTWGEIYVPDMEPETSDGIRILPFKEMKKENGKIVSLYEGKHLSGKVTRFITKKGRLREEYELYASDRTVWFLNRGTFGIIAPFNGNYTNADICLKERCHAHLWCGGEFSWIETRKMGFFPYGIGLYLREGSLSGYSVECLGLNGRGDFILHPDTVILQPGEKYCISWEIFVYPDGKFQETLIKTFSDGCFINFLQESVFPGEKIEMEIRSASQIRSVRVTAKGKKLPLRINGRSAYLSWRPEHTGEYRLEIELNGKKGFARCISHPVFSGIVKKRILYIVKHQQFHQKNSPLDGAFLIYDRESKEKVYHQFVPDHNAARERIAMGLLLAVWLQSHPEEKTIQKALDDFEAFVLRELFDAETGYVYNTIGKDFAFRRLYNAPWLITFWQEMFRLKKKKIYLEYMIRTLRHYYSMGGVNFYPNGAVFADLPDFFRSYGMISEADEAEDYCRRHVEIIRKNGTDYPEHELTFEQTIVTPACSITGEYALHHAEKEWVEETRKHILLLRRFDGNQPDFHLNAHPIRYWDGYWFGKKRMYGDTGPHYWSVLSARAYLKYWNLTGDESFRKQAERCMRNTLCLYNSDGSASCAYLYPVTSRIITADGDLVSCGHGEFYDAWANDQDFALYFILRHASDFEPASVFQF